MKEEESKIQTQERSGNPMIGKLLKLKSWEYSSERVDSLSDHERDILRWQDDGAPLSLLDDDLI